MYTGKMDIRSAVYMELVDITRYTQDVATTHQITSGLCYLYNPHTTAGLTINEGADPDVQDDIITGLRNMVPMHLPYKHAEGNSPSHIMASLMGSSLTIFIENSRLILGRWQKIFFCEFDGPRSRHIHWRLTTSN